MIEILEVLIISVLDLFGIYCVYKIMRCFFEIPQVESVTLFLVYIFVWAVWLVNGLYENPPAINLSLSIVGVFIITICYQAKLVKRVMITAFIMMCFMIQELVVAVLVGNMTATFWGESLSVDLYYTFLMKMVFWIMTLIIARFQNIKKDVQIPISFSLAIIMICILSVILPAAVFHEPISRSILLVFFTCIILLNIILAYMYDVVVESFWDRYQMKLMETEKSHYYHELQLLQEHYREMKSFRHDYKNHLGLIGQMIQEEDSQKVKNYIETIIGSIETAKIYSHSGNIEVDSILNYLLAKAESCGILVRTQIQVPEQLAMGESDLLILISNLIDNAIEANEKAVEEERKIDIEISYEKSYLKIIVKNTYFHKIYKKNGKLLTSKQDKKQHGIGLQNVESVIQKYNGIKNVEYDGRNFEITIVLYL